MVGFVNLTQHHAEGTSLHLSNGSKAAAYKRSFLQYIVYSGKLLGLCCFLVLVKFSVGWFALYY